MPADGAAITCDVLVVGGGMAGATAALAARDAGARVALARRAPGSTGLSGGAVSVAHDPAALPDAPFGGRAGVVESARRIAATHPGHPYHVLRGSLDRLWTAVEFATGQLSSILAPPSGRNRWLLTPFGKVHPAATCQRSMVAGDLAEAKGVLAVVAPRGHLWWDAGLVASGAIRARPLGAPETRVVALDLFLWEDAALARPVDLARLLEAPGAAEEVGRMLAQRLPRGATVALFPPILGLSPGARVPERVEGAAGVQVAEFLSDLPSVPGLRLQRAVDERLAASGVTVLAGEVHGAAGPGAPARVGGREVVAESWVLASGRFVGGGIARRGELLEPALGLPVLASEGAFAEAGAHLAARPAASLTVRDSRSPQPLLSAGLKVDAELHPLDADGRVASPRLFAAGAVVGGHDQASDGTGMGVAMLTGWLAGRSAAAVARARPVLPRRG
ncbi:MAG TPA: FAD-binding protein [Anaeromyxobacteraceae bacterium]|nr:FAD-binding protein [Anaeromyxobacteraceae bacterium]